MTTLRQEIAELERKGDIATLTQMKEVMEDSRENVSKIMESKQDMGLGVLREYGMIKTASSNIKLVNDAILSILARK